MTPPSRYRRIRPAPLVGLVLVWVALWGNLSWVNVLSGLAVGAAILVLFPLPPLMSTVRLRPAATLVLVGRFLVELVTASIGVALLALRPRPITAGSLVDVRLHLEDDLRRTLVAEMTSLVPGTVVIDLDPGSGIMTIHVLDVVDRAGLDREVAKIAALERRVAAAVEVGRRPDGHGSRGGLA